MSRMLASKKSDFVIIADRIVEYRSASLRRDWWTAILLSSTTMFAVVLISVVADFVFVLEPAVRGLFLLSVIVIPTFIIWRCVFYRRRERLGDRSIARQIECLDTRAAGYLLSAVDLHKQLQADSSEQHINAFHHAALEQSAREVSQISTRYLVDWSRPNRIIKFACLMALSVIFLLIVPQLRFAARCQRILMPWLDLPPVAFYNIEILEPNDKATHIAAEEFSIVRARVTGPRFLKTIRFEMRRLGDVSSTVSEPIVNKKEYSPEDLSIWNLRSKNSDFETNIRKSSGLYEFRFVAGDYILPWRRLIVSERPKIDHFQFTVSPPLYADHPPRSIQNVEGVVNVVRGSRVSVDLETAELVTLRGSLSDGSGTTQSQSTPESHFRLIDQQVIYHDLTQSINFRSEISGLDNSLLDRFQITAVKDRPANVRWRDDPKQWMFVKLGQTVNLAAIAEDEFTLKSVSLQQRPASMTNNDVQEQSKSEEWREVQTEIQTKQVGESTEIVAHFELSDLSGPALDDYVVRLRVIDAAGQVSHSPIRNILFAKFDLDFSRSEVHELKRRLLISLRNCKRTLEKRVAPERVRSVIATPDGYSDSRAERLAVAREMQQMRDFMQSAFDNSIQILESAQKAAKREVDSQSLAALSQFLRLQLTLAVKRQTHVIEQIIRSTQPDHSADDFDIRSELDRFNRSSWQIFSSMRSIVTFAEDIACMDSINLALRNRRQMLRVMNELTAANDGSNGTFRSVPKLMTFFASAIQKEFGLFQNTGRQPWEQFTSQTEQFVFQIQQSSSNSIPLVDKYIKDLSKRTAPNAWCNLPGQFLDHTRKRASQLSAPIKNSLAPTVTRELPSIDYQQESLAYDIALEQLQIISDISDLNQNGERAIIEDLNLIQSAVADLKLRYWQLNRRDLQPESNSQTDRTKLNARRFAVLNAAAILEANSLIRQASYLANHLRRSESARANDVELRTENPIVFANVEWLLIHAGKAIGSTNVPKAIKKKIVNAEHSDELITTRQSLLNRFWTPDGFVRLNVELRRVLENQGEIIREIEPFVIQARETLRIDRSTLSQRIKVLASDIKAKQKVDENTVSDIRELAEVAAVSVANSPLNNTDEIARVRTLFQSSKRLSQTANYANDLNQKLDRLTSIQISESIAQIVAKLGEIADRLEETESGNRREVDALADNPSKRHSSESIDDPLSERAQSAFDQAARLANIASLTVDQIIERITDQGERSPTLASAIERRIGFELQRLAQSLVDNAIKLRVTRKEIATTGSDSQSTKFADARLQSLRNRWQRYRIQSAMTIAGLAQQMKLTLPEEFVQLRKTSRQAIPWRPIDQFETNYELLDRHVTDLRNWIDRDSIAMQSAIDLLKQRSIGFERSAKNLGTQKQARTRVIDFQSKLRQLNQNAINDVAPQQSTTDAVLSRVSQELERLERQFGDVNKEKESNQDNSELKRRSAELQKRIYSAKQELRRAKIVNDFQIEATRMIKQESADFESTTERERPRALDSLSEIFTAFDATNTQFVTAVKEEADRFESLSNSLVPAAYTGDFDQRSEEQRVVVKDVAAIADETERVIKLIETLPKNSKLRGIEKRISKTQNRIYFLSNGPLTDLADRLQQTHVLHSPEALSEPETEDLLRAFSSSGKQLLELAEQLSLPADQTRQDFNSEAQQTDRSSQNSNERQTAALSEDDIAALLDDLVGKSLKRRSQDRTDSSQPKFQRIKPNEDADLEDADLEDADLEDADLEDGVRSAQRPPASEIISQSQRNLGRQIADLLRQSLDEDSAKSKQQNGSNQRRTSNLRESVNRSSSKLDKETPVDLRTMSESDPTSENPSKLLEGGPAGSTPGGADDEAIDLIDVEGESTWGRLRKKNAVVDSESRRSSIPEQYREISRQYLRAISELNKRNPQQ